MMKILSKMETGQGGNWILVDYGNNFYACKKNIEKAKHEGWTVLIQAETKELEMLLEFSRILKLQ